MTSLPVNQPRSAIAGRYLTAMLWASAAVLAILVFVQSTSWLDAQPFDARTAHASGMVSSSGPLVVMTCEAGKEDLTVVLDNRTETLKIYHLDSNSQPQLYQQLSLPNIFAEAHARGPGRR